MIGLGTYSGDEGDIGPVLKAAIMDHGYRMIDTAKVYGNED
jgi:diketogulonate reductase-like aldo/keto reductase